MEHAFVLFRTTRAQWLSKKLAIPAIQARHYSCSSIRPKALQANLTVTVGRGHESREYPHLLFGSATARVMTGVDVIRFEGPRASQRTLFMADDCSHCREKLARLTEENAALRRAALAFGGLAERLNLALQEERRARQRSAGPFEATAEKVGHAAASLPRMRSHSGAHQG